MAAGIKDTKSGVVFWNNGFIGFWGTTTCVRSLRGGRVISTLAYRINSFERPVTQDVEVAFSS
jgi:hypothetical protein